MERPSAKTKDPWIEYLVSGYVMENLEAAERRELDNWVDASKDNQHQFEDMTVEKIMEALLQWETKLAASKETSLKEIYS